MKAINHFQQNRPVHLARRDVYFERAAELIHQQQQACTQDVSMEQYEEILFLLRVARQQARFAIRETGKNEADEQFGHFINLLAGNVKAVLSMMNLRGMVESSEGSFFSFLGANQASVALQAEEYQRRANDIIHSLHNTLRLAEDPFVQLKSENSGAGTDEERTRYAKAREHFTTLVVEGRHRYKIAKSARKAAHF
ncbi:hypothetical protein P4B35_02925 [Pontiellaceae bacterium B12227]|nr:hypothetical protein [Pontiellaceae bacterium B12227]